MTDPRDIYGTRLSDRMMMPNRVMTGDMVEVPIPTVSPTLNGAIAVLEDTATEIDALAVEISHALRGSGGQELKGSPTLPNTPTERITWANSRLVGVCEELRRVLEAIR